MKDEKEIKLPSPLLLWLMFTLPLALSIIQPSLFIAIGLYAIAIILFITYIHQGNNLWRVRSYAVNLILLGSTLLSYVMIPEYHTIWTLTAIFLSSGWRWGLNLYLSQMGIPQYMPIAVSSALSMHASLLYLLSYILMGLFGYQHDDLTNAWVPIGLIIIIGGISTWYIRKSQGRIQHFSCPENSALVRMAIVKDDQIWLTTQPYTGCFMDRDQIDADAECNCCKKNDQPLTSCIHPGETSDQALSRAIKNSQLKSKIPPRYLLKYKLEDEHGSREVHLYVINIRPKSGAIKLTIRGRFYTPFEIDELSKMGYFSPLFLQEYNYLSHTLFPANALAKAHTDHS